MKAESLLTTAQRSLIWALLLSVPLAVSAQHASDVGTLEAGDVAHDEPDYSPFVDRAVPDRVLWGDSHLHTSYSVDAGFFGNTLGPEEAYRFARGEEVTSSTGVRVKLIRPLDWLVVADHGVYYGMPDLLRANDPVLQQNPVTARWQKLFNGTREESYKAFEEALVSVQAAKPVFETRAVMRTVWDTVVGTSERYNEPGSFTALHGYEWSTNVDGDNIHRVVMFRDGEDRVRQVIPFSAFDSSNVEDLWAYMSDYEAKTGGRVMGFAHNGNWSNGKMFSLTRDNGRRINSEYATMRQRFEPVYEVTQIKGDGEVHPSLSPNDEFADYGTLDKGNLGSIVRKSPEMLPHEYARSALQIGLQQEAKLGVNPFKFGMIGATDSHTSLATTREDNYFGKNPAAEPSAGRWDHLFIKGAAGPDTNYMNYELLASGLAGVWAHENTREGIWDAFNRREVYATTGSRITVRLFAGWDFTADEVERQDFADRGYAGGVPMGGDLSMAPDGKAPKFMIRALRDPDNANLDRVQVIKGWIDDDGNAQELIYDVACSDDRAIVDRHCERAVGSTVDGATYTNTIGDPLLTAYWKDPIFVPDERAFYYVRVIEIPKPSWQAYDEAFYGLDMPDHVDKVTQDRAYTSPIWYTP